MPDDCVSVGYKEVRPFHLEQVFRSMSCGFVGTEKDFVKAGYAYKYIKLDNNSRIVVN